MKVVVTSTFDIWPPRDGGSFRYAELYSRFSSATQVVLLVYDFRNRIAERRYRLAPNVEVRVPPATVEDAERFEELMSRTGLWLHDILCLQEHGLSDAFMKAAREELATSDAVVASHPYLADVAFDLAPARALRVYEAHNVEHDIKRGHLGNAAGRDFQRGYLAQVTQAERLAVHRAHHVTAVSEEDRDRLVELYGASPAKISLSPNGAVFHDRPLLSREERIDLRKALGRAPVGAFVGSAYGPNLESYRRSRLLLESAGFRGRMIVAGSIAGAVDATWERVGFEEVWLGFVADEVKRALLETADFALHLVYSGAGTNLKLFDYIDAGVPIIANAFGMRGVDSDEWWPAETAGELRAAIEAVAGSRQARERAGAGRIQAAERFDWSQIANKLERGLRSGFALPKSEAKPSPPRGSAFNLGLAGGGKRRVGGVGRSDR